LEDGGRIDERELRVCCRQIQILEGDEEAEKNKEERKEHGDPFDYLPYSYWDEMHL